MMKLKKSSKRAVNKNLLPLQRLKPKLKKLGM